MCHIDLLQRPYAVASVNKPELPITTQINSAKFKSSVPFEKLFTQLLQIPYKPLFFDIKFEPYHLYTVSRKIVGGVLFSLTRHF